MARWREILMDPAAPAIDMPKPWRPAPHPGPRCATDHRAVIKARKARAHEKMVSRAYGLAPGDYDRLKAAQGGRCAICQIAKGESGRRLPVDHDHKTGEIRGLVCTNCNRHVLGLLGEAGLRRALAYLADPPARRVLDNVRVRSTHD